MTVYANVRELETKYFCEDLNDNARNSGNDEYICHPHKDAKLPRTKAVCKTFVMTSAYNANILTSEFMNVFVR